MIPVYELDTAAEPQAVPHAGPAQSSLSLRQGIALVSFLQCQVHGTIAAKSSMSKGENLEIPKTFLVMTTISPPVDIRNVLVESLER